MVFKNLCVSMLWTKVVSALEGLSVDLAITEEHTFQWILGA